MILTTGGGVNVGPNLQLMQPRLLEKAYKIVPPVADHPRFVVPHVAQDPVGQGHTQVGDSCLRECGNVVIGNEMIKVTVEPLFGNFQSAWIA